MCATVSVKGLFGAVPSPRGRGAPPGGQGTAGRPWKAGGEGHVGRPVTTPCQKRNRRLQFALSLRELSAARWEAGGGPALGHRSPGATGQRSTGLRGGGGGRLGDSGGLGGSQSEGLGRARMRYRQPLAPGVRAAPLASWLPAQGQGWRRGLARGRLPTVGPPCPGRRAAPT